MIKGLKKTGMMVLFLLAAFLFLATLRESLAQIQVTPGNPASPVQSSDDQGRDQGQDQGQDDDNQKDKAQKLLEQELKRLELSLANPLIFYLLPTIQEEGFVFDTRE